MPYTTTFEITVVTDDKPDENVSDDALWSQQMLGEGSILSVVVTGVHELPPPDEPSLVEMIVGDLSITPDGELIEHYGEDRGSGH